MTTRSTLQLLFGAAALGFTGMAGAQVAGAIHTTTPDGAIVNENVHYTAKADVFLTGGPGPNAPPEAAGLPAGQYYFQITDPSGKKLLSTDPVRDRCVVVGNPNPASDRGFILNQRCDATWGPGNHLLNPKVGTASEYVVQMIPFDDTPNNGGVYKAWMTPVEAFVGNINSVDNDCSNGCFHGFVESTSKTDNFKVRDVQTFCVTAWKFIEDKKTGTAAQAGWPILFGGNVEHTGEDGSVSICELTPGTYSISELLPDDFIVVGTQINRDVVSPPVTSVTVTVGKGTPSERNPNVIWTNRNVFEQPCQKGCYYK